MVLICCFLASCSSNKDRDKDPMGITLDQLEAAADWYYIKHHKHPSSLEDIRTTVFPSLTRMVDVWGTPFQYTKGKELRSAGPDKKMNTEDDRTLHWSRDYMWTGQSYPRSRAAGSE